MFLAVSGALLGSVMALISGEQAKTEFSAGMRDFESQIQDHLNDIATGFYPDTGGQTCGSSPTTQAQGRNEECIFAGKALQFTAAGTNGNRTFNTYTIAGQRRVTNAGEAAREVSSIQEATPRVVGGAASTGVLPYGLEFRKAFIGSTEVYGIALVASFGQTDTSIKTGVVSGTAGTSVLRLDLSRNADITEVRNDVSSLNSSQSIGDQPVIICIAQGGLQGRLGAVTISGRGTEILVDDNVPSGCRS